MHLPLPSAPTKDDYMDRMPASLRKMLALKVRVCACACASPTAAVRGIANGM